MSRQAFSGFTRGISLIMFAGLLWGCDFRTEPARQSPSSASEPAQSPADSSEPEVTIDTGDRSIEITEKVEAWPSELPAEVPRFASGAIRKIIRTETPEANSWDMVIDRLPARALKDYEAALKKAGFETSSMIVSEKEGDRGSVTGQKGPVTVVMIASGGNASLSVILTQ